MVRYIIKRLLQSIPLLLGIATLTFFIIHLAPGDPMDLFVNKNSHRPMDPVAIEMLRHKYGLDQPVHIQYIKWLGNVVKGDLGESFVHHRPVSTLLAEAIPYTLQLTVLALLLDALLGITLGILSAVKKYTLLDKIITLGSLIIYSIPGFWLALMLVMVFSVGLGWFPTSQTRSFDYEFMSMPRKLLDLGWHLVLPVFVMGVASAAGTARYMRSRLLEVLNEEYILAARARGIPERTVIMIQALRNALIPNITIYGIYITSNSSILRVI